MATPVYSGFIHSCFSIDEWLNTLQYLYTMGYYLALKGNELPGHEKTQRKLNCMALSERSQAQGIDCVIPAQVVYKSQSFETGKRIMASGNWGEVGG